MVEVAVEVRLDHQAQVPLGRAHLVAVQVPAGVGQETLAQPGELYLVFMSFLS